MEEKLPFVYLSISEVCAAFGECSRSTLYNEIKSGELPAPDKIGSRSLWRSDVIEAWLERRAAQAEAERDERTNLARAAAKRMVIARVRRRGIVREER